MNFFDSRAHSVDHLIELRATTCGKPLSMGFLKEPKFLKGDNSVASGNLQVELYDC